MKIGEPKTLVAKLRIKSKYFEGAYVEGGTLFESPMQRYQELNFKQKVMFFMGLTVCAGVTAGGCCLMDGACMCSECMQYMHVYAQ